MMKKKKKMKLNSSLTTLTQSNKSNPSNPTRFGASMGLVCLSGWSVPVRPHLVRSDTYLIYTYFFKS